jgi:hypothetical protein
MEKPSVWQAGIAKYSVTFRAKIMENLLNDNGMILCRGDFVEICR